MRIFLEDAYTKSVEGRNIACVVVACELTDSVSHFGGGFVCKGNTKYVRWKDAYFVYKICKTVGEGSCLSGTGACYYSHVAFCCCDCGSLLGIEAFENVCLEVFVRLHMLSINEMSWIFYLTFSVDTVEFSYVLGWTDAHFSGLYFSDL